MVENNRNNNLLSICCLGYNHANFIKNNIEAIWNSSYKNIEIIVVDDGSKDNSEEILKELQEKSPVPMEVILQENTGNIGHNFNVALHKAKGEFISFISLDDILCSEQIEKCINKLIANTNLAFIASSKVAAIDNEGNKINTVSDLKLDTLENPNLEDLLNLEYNEFNSFYIQGCFFRKDIIDATGGFDEDMTGDDIILRTKVFRYMQKHSKYTFEILKEPTCYYRRHGNNISLNIRRQIKIVSEYLQRYWTEREYPDILVNLMIEMMKGLTFNDSLNVFTLNAKSAYLLNNEKIQKILIKKAVKEYKEEKRRKSFFRFIFFKEKFGEKRVIKILNFIKISYIKKYKKVKK